MSKFYINGEIVQNESSKYSVDDVCPTDLKQFIDGLPEGEDIELQFSSLGGDVLGGLQICSMISDARKNGHKSIANVTSIAASMASVIACACDELNLYEGAFLMCHLPWTMAIGNSNDLQKEIATLEQMKKSMVKFYKTKFDMTDDEIDDMLEKETWIDSDNYTEYKLNCSIIPSSEPMRIAASISDKHFKNIPKRIMNMKNEEKIEKVEEEKVEEPKAEEPKTEEKVEEPKTEEPKSEEPDQDDIEELRKTIEILKEENEALKNKLAECEKEKEASDTVSKAECEKRVSGMQASMQKQINDFKSQLKVKEEELTKAQADVTRLNDSLEQTAKELSYTASILAEKTQALDKLNSSVNAQAEEIPTMKDGLAKCATPAEKVAFLKSGKYVK